MYLKRLELLGFKSFPDKTIIKLTKGVTAIVGPNGCGKTNILDSIRWVLGEQKVSLLRGTKMEEVIFNGTRDIKPLGMAEVTLVIQNNKGILPTEYGEVQLTRRLFRSGEAEYLLNKVPCRLKDISDLLMDTGIGAHVYSVIQQDMIDAILSDRTDDRRFLFEEAAGISKYKNRKKAALRKLEATEQDLLRLKDIVTEVNTQVNSLNRQMKKAERYQKFIDELKGWEIFLNKSAVVAYRDERRKLLEQKDILVDERIKHETLIDTYSASQEEERKALTDLDRKLTEISNEIYEKSEMAHAIEKDISILKEKRENSRQLKERNRLDIDAFQKRKSILLEQIEESARESEKVGVEVSRLGNDIAENEIKLSEADEAVLSARHIREEQSKGLMALESRLSAGESDNTNLKEQESGLNEGLYELNQSHQDLEIKKSVILEKSGKLEIESSQLAEQSTNLLSRRQSAEEEICGFYTRIEELSGEIFELTASMEAAEARRHLLTEMVTHYEGYGSGVIATFENRDKWPGLHGTVADSLSPKPGYEDAIEAALSEMAGFMICRDRTTAENIIEYLRNEKKGKAGLIILDETGFQDSLTRPEFGSDSGFLCWADECVSANQDLASLTRLLLSRIAIIRPDNVNVVLSALPPYFAAVTTDGKFFQSKAIISGGSNEGLSLFGRREKIAEQEKTLADIGSQIDKHKNSRNELTALLGSRQADLKSINSELDNVREETERIQKEITACRYELQTSDNEIRRLEKEKKSLSDKIELLKSRQYNLTLNYDQLAMEKTALTKLLNEQDAIIIDLERKSEEIQSRLSGFQISQIELRSKKEQLESQIRHTRELISEIEANARNKSDEISTAESELAASDEKAILLEKQLKGVFDARAIVMDNQTRIRDSHSSLQQSLEQREKEIKIFRQKREEASNKLHAVELRNTELEAEIKNILEKVREEYNLNVDQIEAQPPDTMIAEDQRLSRMQELRDLMRNFGAVNLLALEEYRTSKERQEFLTNQMNDLLSAKSTLQSTIVKINVTAKNLFLDTFEEVRGNFKKVFEELFTGGEADIRLLDVDDPLESPIEIIARPRGKKLLSIAQMSGGERALTAISLLFAIYLVKPSPFCILDEIDAPLDDANIHRFLRMIKAFSDQTQFIIITHNKITMEAADILYGITMEQPGISRVVSVRFNDEDDESLIDTSIDRSDDMPDVEIPESIRERMTSKVNIQPMPNPDSE